MVYNSISIIKKTFLLVISTMYVFSVIAGNTTAASWDEELVRLIVLKPDIDTFDSGSQRDEFWEGREPALALLHKAGVNAKINYHFTGAVMYGYIITVPANHVNNVKMLVGANNVFYDSVVEADVTLADTTSLIGAQSLWAGGLTGEGVVIAVIDSGVAYNHSNLGNGCYGQPNCKVIGGWDFIDGDNTPNDRCGHGTHVAGIAAANGSEKGVAPDAKILAYRVLNVNGSDPGRCPGSVSNVVAAIDRAVADGADIINLSLGDKNGTPDDAVSLAVNNAVAAGVVVVVSAGNEGASGYGTIGSPAGAKGAITVAMSQYYVGAGEYYHNMSSSGPLPAYPEISKPDIAAPGYNIRSTSFTGGYEDKSGTSMSAPHAAGSAALLLQSHPDWSPEMVRSALTSTTLPAMASSKLLQVQVGTGFTRVNLANAAPVLPLPAERDFGFINTSTTSQFTIQSVAGSDTSLSVSVSARKVMETDGKTKLASAVSVPSTNISLSWASNTIPAIGSIPLLLSVNPSGLTDGYYEGFMKLTDGTTNLRVPFTFWVRPESQFHPCYLPIVLQTKSE